MTGSSSRVGRRGVLTLGLGTLGWSSMVATGASKASAVTDSHKVGVVAGPSSPDASSITVRIGHRTAQVTPRDFPKEWTFRTGDMVTVNLKDKTALPYVQYVEGDASTKGLPRLVVVNENPDEQREFG